MLAVVTITVTTIIVVIQTNSVQNIGTSQPLCCKDLKAGPWRAGFTPDRDETLSNHEKDDMFHFLFLQATLALLILDANPRPDRKVWCRPGLERTAFIWELSVLLFSLSSCKT